MPSFHLPSPSPASSSCPPKPVSVHDDDDDDDDDDVDVDDDQEDSFLWLQRQQARADVVDLMARRARRRYAQLPAKALLDTLPILASPSNSPPPSKPISLRPHLGSSISHLELPTLNLDLNLINLSNHHSHSHALGSSHNHPQSMPTSLTIPPPPPSPPSTHLGASSSTLSASSASLTPDSLFDHHLRPAPRPRKPPPPGRSTHSMMNLNQSPFPGQRSPDHFRYSHLITPNYPRSSSDHRSSWHPPSTSTTSTSPGTPELITSSHSTQRPISTAYTTTTSASSSPPEPSSRRARAIAELVDTEAAYARDMTVARDIYLAKARAQPVQGGRLPPPSFPTRSRISSQSFKRPTTATSTSPSPKTSSSTLGAVLNFGSKKRASAALRRSCANPTALSLPQKTPSSTKTSNSSGSTEGPPMTALDRKVVFTNLEDVTSLAQTFAALLAEAGASDVVDRADSLGACFYQMLPKIEQVFMAYCAKYESANNRLQELAPNLTEYLDECQLLARGRTTAWDLPSLLIKPVQRCLKYPLLLDQILQLTPLGHPDRPELERAKAGMIAVADSINEAKRRYEYIEEIVGSNKSLPRRKPSRRAGAPPSALVARALNRRIPRRSSTDAVLGHMIERLEESRRAVMRLPATLMAWSLRMRDMSEHSGKFVEALKTLYLNVPTHHQPPSPGMHWFPQIWNGQPDVRHLQTYQHHVATAASIGPFKVMDARLRSEIIPLCEQLNGLYENPMAVIARRDAKEAELAHSTNPVKVRELIRAIDAQLLAELPRFEIAAARFLDGILRKLAKIQQDASFDLRTLLRHFEKSFSKPTTTTLDQRACIEKLERLAIVNGSSLDRHRQHHESFVFLEHAPMLRVDDEDVVVGHEDQIGIAMTTSSPVLAARY